MSNIDEGSMIAILELARSTKANPSINEHQAFFSDWAESSKWNNSASVEINDGNKTIFTTTFTVYF